MAFQNFQTLSLKHLKQQEEREYKNNPAVYTVKDPRDGSSVYAIREDQPSELSAYAISMIERYSVPKEEMQLINAYRDLAKTSDVDEAIREIVNECFSSDGRDMAFKPVFKPESQLSLKTQKKIEETFEYIYHYLLDFDKNGQAIFRQWYVDGRLIYHIAVDKSEKTIKHIQLIDPRYIKRIKEVVINKDTGLQDKERSKIYYVYLPESHVNDAATINKFWNENSFNYNAFNYQEQQTYIKFEDNSIAYSDSGLIDQEANVILSNLHKVLIPYNNMKMMEEAMIIYRIVRAPERRYIYIDVGGMGNAAAQQHLNYVKNTFNNKTVFDSSSKGFINRKAIHSMVEDYYLARRDGQKGTEIQTAPGAENLGVTKDIEYLRDKFYRALNVPIGRLDAEMQNSTLLLGRVSEMQRDEYRFRRFIDTLRSQFIPVVEKLLKTELILKNVITNEDWEDIIQNDLFWEYTEDNSFVEIKKQEKLRTQLELIQVADPYIGKYFTHSDIMKNVMNYTDNEVKEFYDRLKMEKKEHPEFYPPEEAMNSFDRGEEASAEWKDSQDYIGGGSSSSSSSKNDDDGNGIETRRQTTSFTFKSQ